MYPLVLNAEETYCLRSMIQITHGASVIEAIRRVRREFGEALENNKGRTIEPALFQQVLDFAALDTALFERIMEIAALYRDLEVPLIHAQRTLSEGHSSVIVSVTKAAFDLYLTIISKQYLSGADPDTAKLAVRIEAAQPSLRAMMQVAEEQQKANVAVNMQAAQGRQ